MLISYRLPGQELVLFSRPSEGILPRFSRPPIGCNNDESNHSRLIHRQPHNIMLLIFTKIFTF